MATRVTTCVTSLQTGMLTHPPVSRICVRGRSPRSHPPQGQADTACPKPQAYKTVTCHKPHCEHKLAGTAQKAMYKDGLGRQGIPRTLTGRLPAAGPEPAPKKDLRDTRGLGKAGLLSSPSVHPAQQRGKQSSSLPPQPPSSFYK